jgi:hypothetical protein
MNQNQPDNATKPRSVDQRQACSPVELAATLRTIKMAGAFVGGAMCNNGMITPNNWGWWKNDKAAAKVTIDFERLITMLKDGSFAQLRNVGVQGINLLCDKLNVTPWTPPRKAQVPKFERCPHCGQRLPKEMRENVADQATASE